MNTLEYYAVFNLKEELHKEIDKLISEKSYLPLISIAAFYNKEKWSKELIDIILENIDESDEFFPIWDELIYYLTYFDDGIDYFKK